MIIVMLAIALALYLLGRYVKRFNDDYSLFGVVISTIEFACNAFSLTLIVAVIVILVK